MYFEVKVKYVKTDENGKDKKVNEGYLVDAMSYTEAEARMIQQLEQVLSSPFLISNIKRSNITEVLPSDDESNDRWYKVKYNILDADELTGKEKKMAVYTLVAAKDNAMANAIMTESLSTFIVPVEIAQVVETNIVDVLNK